MGALVCSSEPLFLRCYFSLMETLCNLHTGMMTISTRVSRTQDHACSPSLKVFNGFDFGQNSFALTYSISRKNFKSI